MTAEMIEDLLRALVPDPTMIIVTHNLGQARAPAGRTAFLDNGRPVEWGETADLRAHRTRDRQLRERADRMNG
ncbi:MAG: hypothetical protein ACRDY1_15580 [Acidimicrobiales bacterium]